MWLYKDKQIQNISDLPEDCFGFIYKITGPDGKFYIGKKLINHKKTKRLGKKAVALQEGRGRKKRKEVSYEESDWLTYWGSSKPLLEQIAQFGEDNYKREILEFAFKSKQLNYLESKYQFVLEVLERDDCWNDSIQGRYFKSDV